MTFRESDGNEELVGETRQTVVSEFFPAAFEDRHPHLTHQMQIEVQIVNGI